VEPFASLVESVRYNAPRFLLNRDLVGPFERNVRSRPHDCASTGELSDSIERFVSKLGWKHEFQKLIEANENPFAESKVVCDIASVLRTSSSPLPPYLFGYCTKPTQPVKRRVVAAFDSSFSSYLLRT